MHTGKTLSASFDFYNRYLIELQRTPGRESNQWYGHVSRRLQNKFICFKTGITLLEQCIYGLSDDRNPK